jgi:hypothetical protein
VRANFHTSRTIAQLSPSQAITGKALAIKVSIVATPGNMLRKGSVPKISQICQQFVDISVKTVLPG